MISRQKRLIQVLMGGGHGGKRPDWTVDTPVAMIAVENQSPDRRDFKYKKPRNLTWGLKLDWA